MEKIKNIPKEIHLQVGELADANTDFNKLIEVTWAEERIFNTDVKFVREESIQKLLPSDDLLMKLIEVLDDYARDVDAQEYGLPNNLEVDVEEMLKRMKGVFINK